MNIQQNVALKTFNTLGVNAFAEYMTQVSSIDALKEVIEYASDSNLPIKVLGGGSNVVLANEVSGLVLQYTNDSLEMLSEDEEYVLVRVGAGLNWHEWVMSSLSKGWFGLQNLAYIPGLVGAAPVQNIGAYGVEVKSVIRLVRGVMLDTGEEFELSNEACQFAYRESIFKHELNEKVLITSVDFRLSKTPQVDVSYAPLDQMAKEQGMPTPLTLANWVIEVRKSKLPSPDILPNAGSFFKNPVITFQQFDRLSEQFDHVPSYPQKEGVKVPAGWLIDQMGFKGKSFGPVSVHKQQALVLINEGGSGEDVLAAAQQIKQAVFDRYGIAIEQEPRIFQ
ncbi:MAG: UDP-N-acetylmuramate dehydrogenase [Gammaproteobacteria bacterium]|nr:UDP-N-acetylmuramate dehydrogenase [Gammaproteobacteria bacterium]